jgi:hypothetical protein
MGQGMCAGLRDALNIAWKLDLVLRGLVPDDLLDTIGSERQSHNEWIINLAVEMGRLSCQLDPAVAAERDASMRAAGAIPPLQFAPLSEGLIRRERDGSAAPLAGRLSVQGHVAANGHEGRFDDVVARGFVLVAAEGDPSADLSPEQAAALDALEATVVSLDDLDDLDGRLTAWLSAHGAHAVLIRPDFYVFGSAATANDVPALVEDLRIQLMVNKREDTRWRTSPQRSSPSSTTST